MAGRISSVILVLGCIVLSAQSPAPRLLEVTSVKINKSADAVPRIGFPPGRLEAVAANVLQLISYAFADRQPLRSTQIIGAPQWTATERFDIAAMIAPGPPQAPSAILRSLLKERFKLTTHAETRELPIYALVRARKDDQLGPRLRPVPFDCAMRIARAPSGTSAAGLCQGGPIPGGVMGRTMRMENLATALSSAVDRPVVDRTGLDGNYDFDVEWKDEGPSVFTAVQEQLGLRLEADRAQLPVIVIDKIDRPSEN